MCPLKTFVQTCARHVCPDQEWHGQLSDIHHAARAAAFASLQQSVTINDCQTEYGTLLVLNNYISLKTRKLHKLPLFIYKEAEYKI